MVYRGSPSPQRSNASGAISVQEDAMQSLCKQLLKSRIFRGHYHERRYVDIVGGYRDIITLQKGEKELERLLLDIQKKLHLFYKHQPAGSLWIGITHGDSDLTPEIGALQTSVWAELSDLAFGQYWFTIKSVRFREREIILKVKMLRPFEMESSGDTWQYRRRQSSVSSVATSRMSEESTNTGIGDNLLSTDISQSNTSVHHQSITPATSKSVPDIRLEDFVQLLHDWCISTKKTIYDFMANDINKDNIKGLLRFIGLFIFTTLAGMISAIQFLGIFLLRCMFEFSRLTHAFTPIILKILEMVNKVIGGIFILVAMIWGDVVRNRKPKQSVPAIEYRDRTYRSIEYNMPGQQQQEERAQRRNRFLFGSNGNPEQH